MSNSDRLFYLLIGVLIGIALGMILAQRPPAPEPQPPCADAVQPENITPLGDELGEVG